MKLLIFPVISLLILQKGKPVSIKRGLEKASCFEMAKVRKNEFIFIEVFFES